jgi:hypothetical protein
MIEHCENKACDLGTLPQNDAELDLLNFLGDTIQVIKKNGKVWIGLRSICRNLGINFSSQRKKLLSAPWPSVLLVTEKDSLGRRSNVFMMDRRTYWMWVSSVHYTKISPELRAKLITYQCSFSNVLDQYIDGTLTLNYETPIRPIPEPGLTISEFLLKKGFIESKIRRYRVQFGRLLKIRYKEVFGSPPSGCHSFVGGKEREVFMYKESHRPIFEAVFLTMFGHDKVLTAKSKNPPQVED